MNFKNNRAINLTIHYTVNMGNKSWFDHCNLHFVAIFVTIGPHLVIDGGEVRDEVPTPLMRNRDTHCLPWLTLSIAIGV
jgi:hypothetical protein